MPVLTHILKWIPVLSVAQPRTCARCRVVLIAPFRKAQGGVCWDRRGCSERLYARIGVIE